MSDIQKAKARLMLASFELGQAQRALEDAETEFTQALNAVEFLEQRPLSQYPQDARPNGDTP